MQQIWHHFSDLVYNFGLVSGLPKQILWPKLTGSGLGSIKNIVTLLLISATTEARNFKFGIQLGFGLQYTNKGLLAGPNLSGIWARGASKKCGTPYLFLQPLKLLMYLHIKYLLWYHIGLVSKLLEINKSWLWQTWRHEKLNIFIRNIHTITFWQTY